MHTAHYFQSTAVEREARLVEICNMRASLKASVDEYVALGKKMRRLRRSPQASVYPVGVAPETPQELDSTTQVSRLGLKRSWLEAHLSVSNPKRAHTSVTIQSILGNGGLILSHAEQTAMGSPRHGRASHARDGPGGTAI